MEEIHQPRHQHFSRGVRLFRSHLVRNNLLRNRVFWNGLFNLLYNVVLNPIRRIFFRLRPFQTRIDLFVQRHIRVWNINRVKRFILILQRPVLHPMRRILKLIQLGDLIHQASLPLNNLLTIRQELRTALKRNRLRITTKSRVKLINLTLLLTLLRPSNLSLNILNLRLLFLSPLLPPLRIALLRRRFINIRQRLPHNRFTLLRGKPLLLTHLGHSLLNLNHLRELPLSDQPRRNQRSIPRISHLAFNHRILILFPQLRKLGPIRRTTKRPRTFSKFPSLMHHHEDLRCVLTHLPLERTLIILQCPILHWLIQKTLRQLQLILRQTHHSIHIHLTLCNPL